MTLLRSMLFTPGNNMRMITKAGLLGADAVIFDLEDSVPMPDKETARLFVRDGIADAAACGVQVFVRINAFDTGLSHQDLEWVVGPGLNGIVLPKAQTGEDVTALSALLESMERRKNLAPGSPAIVPILESAKGVVNAYAIAAASPRVVAIAFGGVDFSRDMAVKPTKDGVELFYPRAQIAVSARAAGVWSIDTPCISVNDPAQLKADAQTAKRLGFRGKLLIHPLQVGPVNEVFSPDTADVAYARKIVEAFDEAQKQGQGAISFEGKMVDVANYRQAKDLLDAARAIAKQPA